MGVIDNIIQDKQDIKNQLGSTPSVFPTVKKFNNNFEVKRHSTKLNTATISFGSFVLNSSSFGRLGTDTLGRGGHTDSLYAVVPHNNIFVERFYNTIYIDTSASNGIQDTTGSYTLDAGEILQSEVIAKIRQPITSATFYSNDSFVDSGVGIGMVLPFTLGVSTFAGDSASIYLSNDSGSTWVAANEGEVCTFPTSATTDELKYKIISGSGALVISDSIIIKVI